MVEEPSLSTEPHSPNPPAAAVGEDVAGESRFDSLVDAVVARLMAGEPVGGSAWDAASPDDKERLESLLPALTGLVGLTLESEAIQPPAAGDSTVSRFTTREETPASLAVESGDCASRESWSSADRERSADRDRYIARQMQGFLDVPRQADEIGRLAEYRVLAVLGAGGAGIVLRAEDETLRREVAIKVMAPPLAALPATRARFRREAQVMAAIENDHVVSVHRVGEHRGLPFLVMPLLKGETLGARMRRDSSLPLAELLRIGREIATGLAAAHERGLLHRDIKPDNIWLCVPNARVRVLDFGLAHSSEDDGLTLTGSVLGTPRYMSPEQARGEAIDARSDLFSLGTVLYRAATGQCPFEAKSYHGVVRQICELVPPPVVEVATNLPAGVSRLIERLLEKSPDRRPASAAEVVAELRRLESSEGDAHQRHSVATLGSDAASRRWPATLVPRLGRRWIYAPAALAALALALWLLGFLPKGDGGQSTHDEPSDSTLVQHLPSGVSLVAILMGGQNGAQPIENLADVIVNDAGDQITISEGPQRRMRTFDNQGRELVLFGGPEYQPGGLAFGRQGEVFVCDDPKGKVFVFSADGALTRSFPLPGNKEWHPRGIAFGKNELLYVADEFNHCIQVFSATGAWQRSFGDRGKKDGQFNLPIGVAIDESGDVYVSDFYNHRVQVFTAEGVCRRTFGEFGQEAGNFDRPHGLAVDRAGRIYVADHENHRIQVFDRDRNVLLILDCAASPSDRLKQPNGLALDGQGRLYVADTGNNRVVIFRLPWTAEEGAAAVRVAQADAAADSAAKRLWRFTPGKVTLRTPAGRYLRAEKGGGRGTKVTVDAEKGDPDKIDADAVFEAQEIEPGKWAFRARNGFWLNADDGGGKDRLVLPHADRIGPHEVFICETRGDRIAFRTFRGFYLRAPDASRPNAPLAADAENLGDAEQFICENK